MTLHMRDPSLIMGWGHNFVKIVGAHCHDPPTQRHRNFMTPYTDGPKFLDPPPSGSS